MKKIVFLGGLLGLAGMLAAVPENKPGTLVIVGGGMNTAATRIYQTFIARGGGAERIRIAIIPAASAEPAGSGREQAQDFVQAGVPADRVRVFPVAVGDDPTTKDVDESTWAHNAFDPKLVREMGEYNAVFFVGGDQVFHVRALKSADGKDSPLMSAIRKIYAEGGVIGGTSAGAAIMSDPMICNGDSLNAVIEGSGFQAAGSCDESRGVCLTTGLGFFTHGLTDQHFFKRGRLGRSIVALLATNPTGMAMGIDEDTAAVCRGDEMEVIGSSGVLLIDCSRAVMTMTKSGLKAENVVLDYLEEGDRYDFSSRKVTVVAHHKPIEKGKEEYARFPMSTNTFGRDVIKDLLAQGIADNKETQAEAIAFRIGAAPTGIGSRWRFAKTGDTRSYWGTDSAGRGGYTVLHVRLDITPVQVTVTAAE
jgi:cyanophycinase